MASANQARRQPKSLLGNCIIDNQPKLQETSMQSKQIVIYGAGGFAREVAWLVQSCNGGTSNYEVVCFIDDNETAPGTTLNGISVLALEIAQKQFPQARLVSGIGSPQTRQRLIEKASDAGFAFETV